MRYVIDQTTGTGATPLTFRFSSEEDRHAAVITVFTKEALSSDDADAVQAMIQAYLNDARRNIPCTSIRYQLNLPKSESGESYVQIAMHSATVAADDEVSEE